MNLSRTVGFLSAIALVGCGAEGVPVDNSLDKSPDGIRWTIEKSAAEDVQNRAGGAGGQARVNNITYHNGPIMYSGVNAYVIWYGNWAGNSAVTIVENFLASVGGSPYWNINTTYTDNGGHKVSPNVTLAKSITDANYSLGKSLTDANIKTIVWNHINSGELPKDANGIYLLLTSSDVTATSGFCSQYCGWHTYGALSGTNIKYSFVGNPDRCIASCAAQSTSPNGNAGADGMVSIIAHEVEEAATDPQLNAWYDRTGMENADKCAWTFGATSTAGNGSKYNMTLGGMQYLVQQNWVAGANQRCALSYP